MSPAAADPPTTRERLIAATIEVIVERGWGGVSTRIVAEHAGINPGVVHYHFGSIEELRRQAVTHALDEFVDAVVASTRDHTPRQIVEASAWALEQLPESETRMFLEAMPATARDPQLRDALGGLLARYRRLLAERIRACHPRTQADPDVLAALLAASLDGLLLHRLADPELDVAANVAPLLTLLGPEG